MIVVLSASVLNVIEIIVYIIHMCVYLLHKYSVKIIQYLVFRMPNVIRATWTNLSNIGLEVRDLDSVQAQHAITTLHTLWRNWFITAVKMKMTMVRVRVQDSEVEVDTTKIVMTTVHSMIILNLQQP